MMKCLILFCPLLTIAIAAAQPPEPPSDDDVKALIGEVTAFDRMDHRTEQFKDKRNALFSKPLWKETIWRYLNEVARDAEITKKEYDAHVRRMKELLDLARAHEGAASARFYNERQRLGLVWYKRKEASTKLMVILSGLSGLHSEEVIPLIAPLLDSEGIAIYQGDHGQPSVRDFAKQAMGRLRYSGVKFPGALEFDGSVPLWEKWWQQNKSNYPNFKFE